MNHFHPPAPQMISQQQPHIKVHAPAGPKITFQTHAPSSANIKKTSRIITFAPQQASQPSPSSHKQDSFHIQHQQQFTVPSYPTSVPLTPQTQKITSPFKQYQETSPIELSQSRKNKLME